MCFIADLRHQQQGGRVGAQGDFGAAVGKDQLFQSHFAAFAFFHANQAVDGQAQLFKYLPRGSHLAFATVNQHHIGQMPGGRNGLCRRCIWCVVGFLPHACAAGSLFARVTDTFTAAIPAGFLQILRQFAVAAVQHLAHGGVVVAWGDVVDGVASILAGLHGVVLKDDAGCLRGFARGV